jgi:hypothetical protein
MIRPWLCTALLVFGSHVAGAAPKASLNQIKTIGYSSIFDGEVEVKCRIDRQSWKTSLEFVANQSTRLKIMTSLAEVLFDAGSGTPQLYVSLTIIEMQSGCAGVLDARLVAAVEPTRIVATGQPVSTSVELWTNRTSFRASHKDFAQFATNIGEKVLKEFVNDWTKSQR